VKPFDLAIFDLDGTLIDSRFDIADALNAALAELALPTHPTEAVTAMIGDGVSVLIDRALSPEQKGEGARVLPVFRRIYGQNLMRKTRLYPGVAALLAHAVSAGVKLAVATNKPGDWAREIVGTLGLLERFEVVLGDGDGHARKPDPAMVCEIGRQCGAEPQRTLYVGDSVLDVQAGRAAGAVVVAVVWGYTERAALEAAAPDRLFSHPGELATLLDHSRP
jgi:phosphoglycolate phosphatase